MPFQPSSKRLIRHVKIKEACEMLGICRMTLKSFPAVKQKSLN
jgi:hypothetical protein